jgi:hypothetical protein
VFGVICGEITPDIEHPTSSSEDVLPGSLIFLKILFKFNQTETPVSTQIMINTICSRIFCHGRGILEIVEQILREIHLGIPELLDTLTLIHNTGSN